MNRNSSFQRVAANVDSVNSRARHVQLINALQMSWLCRDVARYTHPSIITYSCILHFTLATQFSCQLIWSAFRFPDCCLSTPSSSFCAIAGLLCMRDCIWSCSVTTTLRQSTVQFSQNTPEPIVAERIGSVLTESHRTKLTCWT